MSALRAAGRHEEMKRFPLTLPAVGSTYPYSIDGHLELFTVDRIDLGQGLMYLSSAERSFERPTFINDVVRMVRPNDAAAWLPVLREHYTMDDEGRAALIAEANAPRTVAEDLAWVDSLECIERGPYTPMGPVCHNGEDFARAFPQVPNDDLSRDLYATIGGPVPPLVWPRQESEQSPTRTDAPSLSVKDFALDARVKIAMKADPDDGAEWVDEMDETIGQLGGVVGHTDSGRVLVRVPDGCTWAYAPEALTLENACSKVTKEPAPVDDAAPAKPHAFKAGDRVVVARKVERDSTGHWCFWPSGPSVLGALGVVLRADTDTGATIIVDLASFGPRCFSPEALALINQPQHPLKPGDKVRVARKVVTDSKGRDCDWVAVMTQTIGTELVVSHVESVGDRWGEQVRLANGYWYSPEALDLIEPAP